METEKSKKLVNYSEFILKQYKVTIIDTYLKEEG